MNWPGIRVKQNHCSSGTCEPYHQKPNLGSEGEYLEGSIWKGSFIGSFNGAVNAV